MGFSGKGNIQVLPFSPVLFMCQHVIRHGISSAQVYMHNSIPHKLLLMCTGHIGK